jgi:hypothetical protein
MTVSTVCSVAGHVFLSYGGGGDGGRYVRRLAAHLTASGIGVWFDDQLVPGDEWDDVLADQIATSAAVLVIMTPDAGQSRWVKKEIRYAEQSAKQIVPLLLVGKPFLSLADIQYDDVRGGAMPSAALTSRLRTLVDAADGQARTGVGRSQAGQTVVGNLPHASPGLLARPHLLDDLAALRGVPEAVVVAAVNGARGVGKTQLAAQYARRAVAHGWPVVVWLDAETEEGVVAGLARLAAAVGLPQPTSTVESAP